MEGDSKENPLVMSDDKIEVLPSSDDSYHMRPHQGNAGSLNNIKRA